MAFKDIKNQRFGRLIAIDRVGFYINPTSNNRASLWECVCDCGETVTVIISSLTNGHTQSCGCLQKDKTTKHGKSRENVYKAHFAMKDRCNNPDNLHWDKYGGRGISYDPKWENFEGFWEDMGETHIEGTSLDRIDVNGNYCKENCRWAKQSIQCYNRRMDKKNTSGKTGVSYAKNVNKWYAYIDFEGKRISLKLHDDLESAIKAREEAELKYFGFNKE